MSESTKYDPPSETLGDHTHTLLRAGIQLVPVVGSAANEFLTAIMAPPYQKRQAVWMNDIAEGLRNLEAKHGCIVDDLKNNDSFIDTVIQDSQAAMRTSQQEKREALRNAVLNSTRPQVPDDARRTLFVDFIDTFSALHLRMLTLLDDPGAWLASHVIAIPRFKTDKLFELVSVAMPELAAEDVLCEAVCRDLCSKGLLIATSLRKPINRFPYRPQLPREQQVGYKFADELPADGITAHSGSPTHLRNWTTELGREFLAFISSPET